MNVKRFFLAALVIVIFALLWNGIVHLVILRGADAVLNAIGRPESGRSLWLSLLSTVLIAVLFVWSYVRCARRGTMQEGFIHGLFFGILAGVLVDLNQYILYPVPGPLAISWFGFGLIEFCIYGIVVSRLYPIKE